MKNVVVTGCASGIGKYLFDNLGYNTFGVDIKGCSGANWFKVDLSNHSSSERKLKPLLKQRIDGIVNVAGVCIRKRFEDFYIRDFDDVMGSNVKSVFNMCKLFLGNLKKSEGCVVNVSSVHSVSSLPCYSVYAMSKGAVESFTRSLAVDLSRFGVRVNCIRLGPVVTSMLPFDKSEVDNIPLQRTVDKKDILRMVEGLIENQSMTGSVVTLDCGLLSKLSVEM